MKRAWITWGLTWGGVIGVAALGGYLQETRSDGWLVFAAITLLITSVLHSLLGERFILKPLIEGQDLPKLFGDRHFVPRTLRFVWHLFSIAFVGLAAILVAVAANASSPTLLQIVSATAASAAVVTAAVSRGRHLSWVAFASVALASWLATS